MKHRGEWMGRLDDAHQRRGQLRTPLGSIVARGGSPGKWERLSGTFGVGDSLVAYFGVEIGTTEGTTDAEDVEVLALQGNPAAR
jgi:hypothetical protein